MSAYYFHGLLRDGSFRVRVRVHDLDCFLQNPSVNPTVFYERRDRDAWVASGEIERTKILFDHCNSERNEGE